jgi:hypothetical protein
LALLPPVWELPALPATALPPLLGPLKLVSSEPHAKGTAAASATATNHLRFFIVSPK